MSETGEAWKATWAVSIDGRDISSRLNPYLQSLEIVDRTGTSSDTCRLALDDTQAQIKLPHAGGLLGVSLEGIAVFKGAVDEIQSTGGRGQGRIITLSARGYDTGGKIKAPLNFHRDDVTLQEFLTDAAKRAGLSGVTVDPAFGKVVRDYWSADGESFIHLAERLAREFGGTFKVRGDQAVLAKQGEGLTPSGKPLASTTGTYGDNLISWDISPFVGRPRGKKARVSYFNRAAGRYEHKEVEIEAKYSDADMAKIKAAFEDTGKIPRPYTSGELSAIRQAFDAAGNPIGTLTGAVMSAIRAAFTSLTAAPRSYTPEEMAAISAAFDAPDSTMAATYTPQEMAIIRAAFYTPSPTLSPSYSAADGPSALHTANGKKTSSQRQSGEGTVHLVLTPQVRVESTFIVKGVRPGIDGAYRVSGVTHRLDRNSGSTTELELKQPSTGKDNRTPAFDKERFIGRQALEQGAKNAPT